MNTQAIKRPVDSVIATVTILVMVTLVVCVVWQVFSRYVLNQPSTLTDEMARFSMIWVGLLGAAYTVGAQRHLSIDLFTLEMKGKMRFFNQLTINVAILGFALSVMVIGGLRLVDKVFSTGQISPAMELPMGYVYAVLPLSGLIITFYCALFIADEMKNLSKVKLENSALNSEEKA
jgi:TRAP-type C4-dicarboxylate transport system permease small subunit